MRWIGILGGVASGKSLVAKQLAQLGAGLLDADREAHEVLRTEAVEDAVRRRWGPEVFDADGRIDRARLAGIVFGDSPWAARQRECLEQLIHPETGRRLSRQAQQMADEGVTAVVLDAPLLVEAGWDKLCSTLMFVDAPRRLRLARALGRGWTEKDFQVREGVQESLDEKRERADFVVDNSGSPEATRAQVERFWHALVG